MVLSPSGRGAERERGGAGWRTRSLQDSCVLEPHLSPSLHEQLSSADFFRRSAYAGPLRRLRRHLSPKGRGDENSVPSLRARAHLVALKFLAEAARQKERAHAVVTDQRPQRRLECRGSVLLDQVMTHPGRTVAEHWDRQQPPPMRRGEGGD